MIKNDIQLSGAETRLQSINDDLENLQLEYSGDSPAHLVFQLEREKRKIEQEINAYKHLRNITLKDAIDELTQAPDVLENIGELLAKLRIASGYTQKQLAEKLGWEQSNLSRFENSNHNSQTIAKIAEYLDGLGVWLHIVPSLAQQSDRTKLRSKPFLRTPSFGETQGYSVRHLFQLGNIRVPDVSQGLVSPYPVNRSQGLALNILIPSELGISESDRVGT